jgi:hypothetical protein
VHKELGYPWIDSIRLKSWLQRSYRQNPRFKEVSGLPGAVPAPYCWLSDGLRLGTSDDGGSGWLFESDRRSINWAAPESLAAATIRRCSTCCLIKSRSSDNSSHASLSFTAGVRPQRCRILSSKRRLSTGSSAAGAYRAYQYLCKESIKMQVISLFDRNSRQEIGAW